MPIEQIDFATYTARAGLNAHALIAGQKSMMHMAEYLGGQHPETAAMRWGILCHAVMLEPERTQRELAVFDGTKRGKAWDAFVAEHAGREIVTQEEALALAVLAKQVWKRPDAVALLSEGQHEASVFWNHPDYGAAKARLDVLAPNHIVDLKTTAEIRPALFKQSFARLGSHIQLGWYQVGMRELTGELLPCYVVAVESKPPHDVVIYEVDEIALAAGRDVALAVAKKYRECEKAGAYPGVCADVQTLRLPDWMMSGDNPLALRIGGEDIEV